MHRGSSIAGDARRECAHGSGCRFDGWRNRMGRWRDRIGNANAAPIGFGLWEACSRMPYRSRRRCWVAWSGWASTSTICSRALRFLVPASRRRTPRRRPPSSLLSGGQQKRSVARTWGSALGPTRFRNISPWRPSRLCTRRRSAKGWRSSPATSASSAPRRSPSKGRGAKRGSSSSGSVQPRPPRRCSSTASSRACSISRGAGRAPRSGLAVSSLRVVVPTKACCTSTSDARFASMHRPTPSSSRSSCSRSRSSRKMRSSWRCWCQGSSLPSRRPNRRAPSPTTCGHSSRGRFCGERPAVEKVAKALGLSPRTLQRRLGDQGTTYQKLLDEVRHLSARRLLAHTDLGAGEVAFLLGFEELNSFTRAFHGWEGTTPARWRASAR